MPPRGLPILRSAVVCGMFRPLHESSPRVLGFAFVIGATVVGLRLAGYETDLSILLLAASFPISLIWSPRRRNPGNSNQQQPEEMHRAASITDLH